MDKICQCCSCEEVFPEVDLRNGNCPHCFSGNWVRGYIDEPEPRDRPPLLREKDCHRVDNPLDYNMGAEAQREVDIEYYEQKIPNNIS